MREAEPRETVVRMMYFTERMDVLTMRLLFGHTNKRVCGVGGGAVAPERGGEKPRGSALLVNIYIGGTGPVLSADDNTGRPQGCGRPGKNLVRPSSIVWRCRERNPLLQPTQRCLSRTDFRLSCVIHAFERPNAWENVDSSRRRRIEQKPMVPCNSPSKTTPET